MKQTVPSSLRRMMAFILCMAMLLPLVPMAVFATETEAATDASSEQEEIEVAVVEQEPAAQADEAPLAVVYAASDFQPKSNSKDDVTGGKKVMNTIIEQMQAAGYENGGSKAVTGALICGDYSNVYDTWTDIDVTYNNAGLAAVAEVLKAQWNLDYDDVVYVQGNHDPAKTEGLDAAGANDTTYYNVYVLHEDDYQWYQGASSNSGNSNNTAQAKATTQATAAALKKYLQAKVDAKDNRPIFIASHVPLHYGWRTTTEKKGDNMYANIIFDVLNEYGKKLNIIFLFGHNHSNTYDDYLGGAAIYLPVGSQILIPQSSATTNKSETLTFTYMNAGYLGYYGGDVNSASAGDPDNGLSSTIFEIYDDKVVVARYDQNSAANLKSAGELSSKDTWSGATADTAVYTNSSDAATINLKTFTLDLDTSSLANGMMVKGSTGTLAVNGLYQTEYDVTWSSSDEAIVSVQSNGMKAILTANATGTATITAVVTEKNGADAVTFAATAANSITGNVTTLNYQIQVVDVEMVTLAEAGTHTFFILDDNQDSSTWAADTNKRYVIVSQDKGNVTAGNFMAMYYNAAIDSTEGDVAGAAAWRELNAEPITVMQLPINGEMVYALTTEDTSFMWNFKKITNSNNSYNWYVIEPEFDRTRALMLSKGHTDAASMDPDDDGIRLRGTISDVSNTSNWRMSNRGAGLTAYCDDAGSTDLYYAPYYDPIQGDFTVYYTQNGDEEMGYRVYMYEETTVTLKNAIVAYMSDKSGAVSKGVGTEAGTGDVIYIQSGDQVVTVPVTLDMLSGTFDVNTPDTYTGLTVTYAGETIADDYTLTVHSATTLLKNEGGKFRSTIYRLVEEMVGGRHYMIVDAAEVGEAHAMGAEDTSVGDYDDDAFVSAHNVLIQSFTVGGEDGLYIDSTRYSNDPDTPITSIIEDHGNVNANIGTADHKEAIRLVWTPTALVTYVPSNTSNAVTSVRVTDLTADYRFLTSEYGNARLYNRSGNGNNNRYDLRLINDGSTSVREEWKYVPSGNADHMLEGISLDTALNNYRLFYNSENYNHSYMQPGYTGDTSYETLSVLDKNFMMEGETEYAPLKRRTWIYELVDDIDAITARMSDLVDDVNINCGASDVTGDYILVETYLTDGTVETRRVPVRVSMLSGNLNTTVADTYTGLTVTYEGKVITNDYTLKIVEPVPNDYPEFPDEGAVKIDKQLDTTKYNYLETGVASVDLSVTGIPAQSGVDIIFILDTSSSMDRCIHHVQQGTGTCDVCGKVADANSRLGLLKETMIQTLKDLQTPIDGYSPDVDVAVACFNGYTPINTDYVMYHGEADSVLGSGTSYGINKTQAAQYSRERIDSSVVSLGFSDVATLTDAQIQAAADGLYKNAGTNYDRGIEIAYNMLKAKQERDALNGEHRQQILVFMSDGSPFQFNYIHGDPQVDQWNNYLLGTMDELTNPDRDAVPLENEMFWKYYHEEGKHWLTEAIKGDPNSTYKIINPDLQDSNDKIEYVRGLGAKVYTVGMGITDDNTTLAASCNHVLQNMASTPESDTEKYFYSCTEPNDFKNAFSEITNTIRGAGNAVFHDQMGTQFDLVTSNQIHIINDQGVEELIDLTDNKPTITVKLYQLYKRSEIGSIIDGVLVTETMVGTRKPVDPTILETITFNNDGTEVYSDKKSGNILNGKVIEAATFFYNTDTVNTQPITVGDKTVDMPPETFHWTIGDIPQDELVLSYNVYLVGSMEGLRPAGTYPTNNYADLSYTNYLGNECNQVATKPVLPWKQGTVGYAFYLVNKDGQPIINQSNGMVGSFERSVKITERVYKDFFLNSEGGEIWAETIEADDVMPEGYTLFDPYAQYEVLLDSDGTGYYIVTGGRTDGIMTTYVEGVAPTAIQPYGQTSTQDYVTANTVVWFAVVAETAAVPDTVVVDYGLPVDVNVLANDVMLGNYGTLKYITSEDLYMNGYTLEDGVKLWEFLQTLDVRNNPGFVSGAAEGKYGVIEVLRDAEGTTTGGVRYTLNESNGMQMQTEETFIYAVEYTGPVGAVGHYLSTVTVIPATTIYYEDNFVKFSTWNVSDDESAENTWAPVGKYENKNQAQDRPGKYSFPKVDANNIYGFDGAYINMATYSMDSAMKFTANNEVYGEAQFTFWGTGFDIVSLTSNNTGAITVDVYDADEFASKNYFAQSKTYMVDTYYGYKYVLCDVTYEYEVDPNTKESKWVKVAATEAANGAVESKANLPQNANDGDKASGVEYAWIVDDTASDTLCQVPVMKVDGLDYKRYTAVITVYYRPGLDHNKADQSFDFYLDAIRIYDPANDGVNSETIKDAYVKDNEGWPEYFELRNLIISKKDFDNLPDGGTNGIIFIDNTEDKDHNTTYTISDYTNFGPNNELYLAPNQAIAFDLNVADTTLAKIHLAMKSVGNEVNVKVYDTDTNKDSVTPITIRTATDLYYDITDLNGKTVVIENVSGSILSITNVKVTYQSAHVDSIESGYFVTTASGARAAVFALMSHSAPAVPEEPVPDTTVPETTVPEGTVPENTKPETTVPGTTVPEDTVSNETVPETTKPVAKPETTGPQTEKPDAHAPEKPNAPEASEKNENTEQTEPKKDLLPLVLTLAGAAALIVAAIVILIVKTSKNGKRVKS